MVRIETAGLGSRKVRIANLPSETFDGVLRTVLPRHGEVRGPGGDLMTRMSLAGGKWLSIRNDFSGQTHSVTHHGGRKQGAGVLWWAICEVLRVQRGRSSIPCMPDASAGEGVSAHSRRRIMGGHCHFNHTHTHIYTYVKRLQNKLTDKLHKLTNSMKMTKN